ncbi:hypothetical protein HXX76_006387 [Chlamydomonas incerta]|uniref:Uncharacterized protein n=1 Tax=Chlamydomonas incerta TaxID=51695 RepID=A0A835T0U6_CHLIN|nr:hypothetical protein HXX76_006387 [Chlamydomonas incerta]|eukprot:KAG2436867.1 hypothetical protein HXX76_006387 [Chlamydomonas incerta]
MTGEDRGQVAALQAPEAVAGGSSNIEPTCVLVTGGVHSGVGKGCAAAVAGRLLARALALGGAPPPLAISYLKLEPCLQFAEALRLNDPACEFEVVADPDSAGAADVATSPGAAGAEGVAEGASGPRRQQAAPRKDRQLLPAREDGQHCGSNNSSGVGVDGVCADDDEPGATTAAPPAAAHLLYDSDVGRARFAIPGFRPGLCSGRRRCCHLSRGELKLGALLRLRRQQLAAAAAAVGGGGVRKQQYVDEAPGGCSGAAGELELCAAYLRRRLGRHVGSGAGGGGGTDGDGTPGGGGSVSTPVQPQPPQQELLVVEVGGTAGEPEHAEMCAALLLALGGPPALHLHVTQLVAAAGPTAAATCDNTAGHRAPSPQPQPPPQAYWSKPAQASLRDMAERVSALLAGCGPAAVAGLTSPPEPDLVLVRYGGGGGGGGELAAAYEQQPPLRNGLCASPSAVAAHPAAGLDCGCVCGYGSGCAGAGSRDRGGGARSTCVAATNTPPAAVAACAVPPAAAAAMAKLGRLCSAGASSGISCASSSARSSSANMREVPLPWLSQQPQQQLARSRPRPRLAVPVAHDPDFPERAFLHALAASPHALARIAAGLAAAGVSVSAAALRAAAEQDAAPGRGAFALPRLAAPVPAAGAPPAPLDQQAQQLKSVCGCGPGQQQQQQQLVEPRREAVEVWVVHDGRGEDGCAMMALRLRTWSRGAARLRFVAVGPWLLSLLRSLGCDSNSSHSSSGSQQRQRQHCGPGGRGAAHEAAGWARPAAVVLAAGAGEALAARGLSPCACACAFGLPSSRLLVVPNSRCPRDRPDWVGTADAPEGPLAALAGELAQHQQQT